MVELSWAGLAGGRDGRDTRICWGSSAEDEDGEAHDGSDGWDYEYGVARSCFSFVCFWRMHFLEVGYIYIYLVSVGASKHMNRSINWIPCP